VATKKRRFEPGTHYHVYGRGNNRNIIFRDNVDRRHFMSKLEEYCERDEVQLLAYCLMDNHFHLALKVGPAGGLTRMMRSLLSGFATRYNRRYGTVGPLFQDSFRAKEVYDEGQMADLTRYIHLNPHPFFDYHSYRWSSYRQYAMGRPGPAEPGLVLDSFGGSKLSYAIFVEKRLSRREREGVAAENR
jgi:REP element-mobilizing transposase RayT